MWLQQSGFPTHHECFLEVGQPPETTVGIRHIYEHANTTAFDQTKHLQQIATS